MSKVALAKLGCIRGATFELKLDGKRFSVSFLTRLSKHVVWFVTGQRLMLAPCTLHHETTDLRNSCTGNLLLAIACARDRLTQDLPALEAELQRLTMPRGIDDGWRGDGERL